MNSIHVNIGEIKTGKNGDFLRATLGSCVGIAFMWKEKGIYGLAHCLLPSAPEFYVGTGARYVTQAIPSLIAMMKIDKIKYKNIEVVLIGGGDMMAQLSCKNNDRVGQLNIESARTNLKKIGFHIFKEEVGGVVGRQVYIDCTAGSIEIVNLPSL